MSKSIKTIEKKCKNNRGKDRLFLEDNRKKAVLLVYKGKMSIPEASKVMLIGKSTISYRLKVYKKKGIRGLNAKSAKTVGRPKKEQNKLTKKEEEIVLSVIAQEPRKTPKLMLDFGLWTVAMIQSVIEQILEKKMKQRKVREYLIARGYSNQRPLFRAYQQNPEKVEERISTTLPAIMEEARKEKREVSYGDEAGFRSTNHKGKTWAKKGETPVVTATGARFGVNAISIVSSKGVLKFMVYEGSFTSETLLVFLKRLVYKNKKKMTIILDGHPTHKSKKVRDYLAEINNQIKIYYLPGYSPELNPDEQVWLHVHNDLKGVVVTNKQELIDKVRKSLYKQQKQKTKLSNYFKHPDVRWDSNQLSKT